MGLILPAIFGAAYIEHFNLWYTFSLFDFKVMGSVWNRLLQVCVFPDLALIFVFYTTDTWRLSKGVLLGALPYILACIATLL